MPDLSGELVVDTVDYAERAGDHEVAAGYGNARSLHRSAGQAHAEACFDVQAQLADNAAGDPCRFRVRDAQLGVIARHQTCAFESRIELRSGAEHDYQTHAEAVEERDVATIPSAFSSAIAPPPSMSTNVPPR